MRRRAPAPPRLALALLLALTAACGEPEPGARPCPSPSGEACEGDAGVPNAAESPPGGWSPRTVSAGDVCPGSAYLCSEPEADGRVHVRRQRARDTPLVVHVPLPDLPDRGRALELQRAASAGVRVWNGHPFAIAVDERGRRPADVGVTWVAALGGSLIGRARTRWSPDRGLEVLALELAFHDPASGRPADPAQVRLTAAHEMGHALGLPHSEEPRDVMHPTNTATSLSARDYRTLEALYALEDGTVIVPAPPRR